MAFIRNYLTYCLCHKMFLHTLLILFVFVKGYCSGAELFSDVTVEKVLVQISGAFSYVLGRERLEWPVSRDVQFNLYTQKNPQIPQILPHDFPSILSLSNFDVNSKTYFIIHGYTDHKNRKVIASLRMAINRHEPSNVIVVDWARLAGLIYFTAANSTLPVGKYLGRFLLFLEKNNVNLENVHLIGHSLGAHISGIAGSVAGGRLGRITGLDPAGPLFEFFEVRGPAESLDASDALFVDIIHTDADEFGTKEAQGHADFYPNGGTSPQPGCNTILTVSCSHIRAIEFYTESVFSPVPFEARHCNVAEEGAACLKETPVQMGHHLSTKARGIYYSETNEESPFAKNVFFVK